MISGTLKKFEPTETGVTVMIHCSHEQLQEIVSQYRKEVCIMPVQAELQEDRETLLKDIRDSLEIIKMKLGGEI